MTRVAGVVYDGSVLRLQGPLDLESDQHYVISIEDAVEQPGGDAWNLLAALAGTVDAPRDWAAEHGHYIHGAPKPGAHSPG